jgi:RNA polymerase sigma-70 factor (ECF subfamily)
VEFGMSGARTNQEWIDTLSGQDQQQAAALADLRDLLLRAALYTLVKHQQDLRALNERDRLALAEDCAQEALQAVLARLPDFRGESKFTTWAYKFGINVALTRSRREGWRNVSLDAITEEDDPLEWIHWEQGLQTAGSELPSLQSEVALALREVLRGELTGRQRQVLKWIAFDDVPMDVVVERLETNRNAIYKLLHDARLKIKQHLAARGYAVEDVYDLFRVG